MNLFNMKMEAIDEVVEIACHRIGNLIEYQAKNNLYQQGGFNTGALQDSIHYDVEKVSNGFLVKLGSNLDYAPFVEFGTGIYGGTNERYGEYASGPGRQTPWHWYDASGKYTGTEEPGWLTTQGQKPKPYIYPAILENGDKIAKIIGKTLNEWKRGELNV